MLPLAELSTLVVVYALDVVVMPVATVVQLVSLNEFFFCSVKVGAVRDISGGGEFHTSVTADGPLE